jgi:hypothetical protein
MTAAERQRRHRQLTAQQEINMVEATQLKVPPPLPETRADLLAQYKLKRRRSINDLVEEVVLKMWEDDEEFVKLVEAIYDAQAVTGSQADDDVLAAVAILDRAKRDKHAEVALQKVHTVKLAMKVVLNRFQIGRHTRFDKAELPPGQPAQTTED